MTKKSKPTDKQRLEAVAKAAKIVRDGWEGQNEIGEGWHDEVDDMHKLGLSLAALDAEGGKL